MVSFPGDSELNLGYDDGTGYDDGRGYDSDYHGTYQTTNYSTSPDEARFRQVDSEPEPREIPGVFVFEPAARDYAQASSDDAAVAFEANAAAPLTVRGGAEGKQAKTAKFLMPSDDEAVAHKSRSTSHSVRLSKRGSSKSKRSGGSSIISTMSFTTKRQRSEESSQAITNQVVCESAELRREAQKMTQISLDMPDKLAESEKETGADTQRRLQKRIVSTEKWVQILQKRLVSVEPVTYLLQQSLQELERASKNAWPLISVAKQRQDIRELCPTGELDKDYLQQALKYEQKTLMRGRKRICGQKDEGVVLLQNLEENIEELKEQIAKKKFHVTHDKGVLAVSLARQKDKASKGLLKDSLMVEKDRDTWIRQVHALLGTICELEQEATKFRRTSDELKIEIELSFAEVAKTSQDLFSRHSKEMTRLRKYVEKEIQQSHETMSTLQAIAKDSKRKLDKIRGEVISVDNKLALTKSNMVKNGNQRRGSLLEAVEANHGKLHTRHQALQEQLTWATRLTFDLHNAHEALEEDHQMKTIAMKYTDKCLLVVPMPDEDVRTAKSRQQIRDRSLQAETAFVELKESTLQVLRRQMRAMASTGPSRTLDLEPLFDKIQHYCKDGNDDELTDADVRMAVRKVFKIGPNVISNEQIHTLCSMLDGDGGGTVDIQELKDFIEHEPKQRDISSIDVSQVKFGGAKERQEQAAVEERPPLHKLPILKPPQITVLKKRIRGAAQIAARDMGLPVDGDALAALFSRFDKDGGGELEDLEVRRAIRKGLKIPKTQLSDTEIWTLIYLIDADGDGSIDISEFVQWVNSGAGEELSRNPVGSAITRH